MDADILSPRHVLEPGYAAFAVMQVATVMIADDLEGLLAETKMPVGEVKSGIEAPRAEDLENAEHLMIGRNPRTQTSSSPFASSCEDFFMPIFGSPTIRTQYPLPTPMFLKPSFSTWRECSFIPFSFSRVYFPSLPRFKSYLRGPKAWVGEELVIRHRERRLPEIEA